MASDAPNNQLANLARELDHPDTFSGSPSALPQTLLTPDQQQFIADRPFFERHTGAYSNKTSKPNIFTRLWYALLNWLHDAFPSSQTYGDRDALLNSEMLTRASLAFKDPSLVRQVLSKNKQFYERQYIELMDPYDVIVIMMYYPKLTTKLILNDTETKRAILEFLQEPTTTSKSLKEHLGERTSLTKPLRPQQKRAFITQIGLLLESSDISSSTQRLIIENFKRALAIKPLLRNTGRLAGNGAPTPPAKEIDLTKKTAPAVNPENITAIHHTPSSPEQAITPKENTAAISLSSSNAIASPVACLLTQKQMPAKIIEEKVKEEDTVVIAGEKTLAENEAPITFAPHAQFFVPRPSANKAIMARINATPDELKKIFEEERAAAEETETPENHNGPAPAA